MGRRLFKAFYSLIWSPERAYRRIGGNSFGLNRTSDLHMDWEIYMKPSLTYSEATSVESEFYLI